MCRRYGRVAKILRLRQFVVLCAPAQIRVALQTNSSRAPDKFEPRSRQIRVVLHNSGRALHKFESRSTIRAALYTNSSRAPQFEPRSIQIRVVLHNSSRAPHKFESRSTIRAALYTNSRRAPQFEPRSRENDDKVKTQTIKKKSLMNVVKTPTDDPRNYVISIHIFLVGSFGFKFGSLRN
jgi:hypothetical protein